MLLKYDNISLNFMNILFIFLSLLGLAFADRGLIVRLLATTLAFNVLLTMSGLVKAIAGDAASRVTLGSWAGGAGMRVLATVVVVGAFALITTARPREDVVR